MLLNLGKSVNHNTMERSLFKEHFVPDIEMELPHATETVVARSSFVTDTVQANGSCMEWSALE